MQISQATQAAPGHRNEDYATAGSGWALVLDGATPASGVVSGCIHNVPWLVRSIAAALTARLVLAAQSSLADLLADAIDETMRAHAGTCDLSNPDSPSSTVAITRIRDATVEHLVLCDSPILLRHPDGQVTRIADDRLCQLPGGPPYTLDQVRAARNQPGGFWVASTAPDAAYHAVCGSAGLDTVTDVALLTDGIARLAEWYGYSWPELFARLREDGPGSVIGLLREAERAHPRPHHKQHDDATVIHMHL